MEFAAQLSTLGLKRGLAQQLAHTDKPHVCVVWDGLLVAALGAVFFMSLLMIFPQAMFPNSQITGTSTSTAATRRAGVRREGVSCPAMSSSIATSTAIESAG